MGMRDFFEAGHCGDVHVVDVFNMTHALVTELPVEETLPLTYDSVHWAEVGVGLGLGTSHARHTCRPYVLAQVKGRCWTCAFTFIPTIC